jgi:hypothetical protein
LDLGFRCGSDNGTGRCTIFHPDTELEKITGASKFIARLRNDATFLQCVIWIAG